MENFSGKILLLLIVIIQTQFTIIIVNSVIFTALLNKATLHRVLIRREARYAFNVKSI